MSMYFIDDPDHVILSVVKWVLSIPNMIILLHSKLAKTDKFLIWMFLFIHLRTCLALL